jgi:tRNA(Leu) C34 or U34 (ribose-2'-O)-methylase TrmL
VILINPKYPHNVGAAVRAASCFGARQVWWTGNRVTLDVAKGERLPREERMKGYRDVEMIQYDYPFDMFPRGTTPVAVEFRDNTENIYDFDHPENPVYVFGPEDGSLARVHYQQCHRRLWIPTRHCLNLAAAVGIVLSYWARQQYVTGRSLKVMDELAAEAQKHKLGY